MGDQVHCRERASGQRKPRFDLKAPCLAMQTPFTEVLAVVRQQPIAVFADTGSRPTDDVSDIESAWRAGPYPDTLAACETSERNFFHRSTAQTVRETRVVNDLASADVDAVMQIAATGRDEVRTQRRFLVTGQQLIDIIVVSSSEQMHGNSSWAADR